MSMNSFPYSSKIAVIAAVPSEMKGLFAGVKPEGGFAGKGPGKETVAGTFRGRPVVLSVSGVGPSCATETTRALLERYEVDAVLSIGYAGGLGSGLNLGDVVIGRRVFRRHGDGDGSWAVAKSMEPFDGDERLVRHAVETARRTGMSYRVGDMLTVDRVVAGSEAKASLAAITGLCSVDMESAEVARCAQEKGRAFLALRVISDRRDQSLGEVLRLGHWWKKRDVSRLVRHLALRPWIGLEGFLWGMRFHRAARHLTRFMTDFLGAR